jgi:hypothetical protein
LVPVMGRSSRSSSFSKFFFELFFVDVDVLRVFLILLFG